MEQWHPPAGTSIPTGPESFPRTGPNALAKVGPRAAARAIDMLLIAVPWFVIVAVALVATGWDPSEPDADAYPPWAAALWVVLIVAYETALVTRWGQTAGKRAVGIKVARLDNGRPPQWWHAAIRVALPAVVVIIPTVVSPIVFMAIYFSASFDRMARGLHDKAAGTVVVTTR